MYQIKIEEFDLEKISESGQCFRLTQRDDGSFAAAAGDHFVVISQDGDHFTFSCGEHEFESFWKNYFDLNRDYGAIRRSVDAKDRYLREAVAAGAGIRILRQDLWEIMVTFLISQNNNISRIRNSVEALCRKFGESRAGGWDGREKYYTFPKADRLVSGGVDDLKDLGLGYRDKYLFALAERCCAANGGEEWMKALREADCESARGMLTKQYGIGKKVADCICLFGLHHVESFPVDTHIRQIIETHYPSGFPLDRYRNHAGIIQQYIFYHKLHNL